MTLNLKTPFPTFGGSTGGWLRSAEVEEKYAITWTSSKEQIFEIIKSKEVKIVDLNTWNNNSYLSRWEFIINKIRRKKSIPYLNE